MGLQMTSVGKSFDLFMEGHDFLVKRLQLTSSENAIRAHEFNVTLAIFTYDLSTSSGVLFALASFNVALTNYVWCLLSFLSHRSRSYISGCARELSILPLQRDFIHVANFARHDFHT
ncbi:hypothetical protein JCGZ_00493 [Jatropha curcas]|uniref:Uncharacterized protein n=1 Tax=Jatropha curcas TaxID=180498 RepID=A0A067LFD7_JATCU|nr:hypothetical protein JCGZ_00493 [Jatropha curcas]